MNCPYGQGLSHRGYYNRFRLAIESEDAATTRIGTELAKVSPILQYQGFYHNDSSDHHSQQSFDLDWLYS